jgi:putative phosphoesterase
MRIGLMSDTHGFVDPAIAGYFQDCDEIWHAGDFGPDVLEPLRATGKPIRGVFGNIDGEEIRGQMPRDLSWECEGLRVYMTHIGGYPGAYERRVKPELDARRPGLFICGHSHILKVMRDPVRSLVHLNPGACGRQGWHTVRTILRFTVLDAKLSAMEAVELGPRSAYT